MAQRSARRLPLRHEASVNSVVTPAVARSFGHPKGRFQDPEDSGFPKVPRLKVLDSTGPHGTKTLD
jgi:hypothetical protein